jgi:hypothetical protein
MEFAAAQSFSGNTIAWTPLSLAVLLLGVCLVLFGPRNWVLPTFLAISVFMSLALQVIIFGQHLMPYRLITLVACARLVMRGEFRGLTLSKIDKTFLLFCACTILAETIRAGSEGFIYAFANNAVDGLGAYFLCRCLFRDAADLKRMLVSLAFVSLVLAGFMGLEYVTGRNWLTMLGAVQDMIVARKGRLRCAASFNIAITAGTFGALLLPLFVGCWWQGGRMKKWAILGCLASSLITVTSGSASPLSTYLIGIIGLCAWPLRAYMRKIRWGTAFLLVALHLVMKAPVWALIMRVQLVPGASAYHRFNVLDTFINNIGQWWLCGVQSTTDWGYEVDDVANQYCVIAKHGGLLALCLFVWVISLAFGEVGRTAQLVKRHRPTELMVWSFGVLLFAHVTAFFGISYFDQVRVIWYISLAMLASVGLLASEAEEVESLEVEAMEEEKLGATFSNTMPSAT